MGSWICLGGLKNDTTAPTTPVIAVTVISSTELDVSLTTPSTDAGGLKQYVLERSPNGSTSWTTLATGASIFMYADTGLTAATTYYYRATASDYANNTTASAVVSAATSSSGAFYTENWDDLSNGASYLRNWSGTSPTASWQPGNGVVPFVSNGAAKTGTLSLKYPYPATAIDDTNVEAWFDLGALYREVTIEYYEKIPSNYIHRNVNSHSYNNKQFRLWGLVYDTREKMGMSTEPNDGVSTSDLYGEWDPNGTGVTQLGTPKSGFISPSWLGQWMYVKIYCKAPTATGTGKAILKVWQGTTPSDAVLIINETPDNYDATNPHAYRWGYLKGTADSGFASATDFYQDQITFTVVA
jgi:hypothetical protein